MKINFKEDPKEWRKSALLTLLGLAMISSLFRWRKHLPQNFWLLLLAMLACAAVCAVLRPRWFRGLHRLSVRLGFYSSQFIGRGVLLLFFILIMTPLGVTLRMLGKDLLKLKRVQSATYWQPAKVDNPLDRMF
jgi:hypothetical protein